MRQADKSIKQRENHPKNETSQVTDIRHSEQKKADCHQEVDLICSEGGSRSHDLRIMNPTL